MSGNECGDFGNYDKVDDSDNVKSLSEEHMIRIILEIMIMSLLRRPDIDNNDIINDNDDNYYIRA